MAVSLAVARLVTGWKFYITFTLLLFASSSSPLHSVMLDSESPSHITGQCMSGHLVIVS